MNREIKFRVWNTSSNSFLNLNGGEWGYYYITPNGKFMVYYNGLFGNPCETKELDYMIVQQYTGLKDKNGKEIYEGDIVRQIDAKFPDNIFEGVVRYDIPNAAYLIHNLKTHKETGLGAAEVYFEIVGNAFEDTK